jgi:hypothetical protein
MDEKRRLSMADTVVFGIYRTRDAVEQAVEDMKNAGLLSEDISLLFTTSVGTQSLVPEKNTKAPEGAATGAASGAVVGGALGWLAGIGSIAIPGLGPFIAAGPIMGALAGAGMGGTVGGLAGTLIGLGMPEYEAKRYDGSIKEGAILVSVHSDDSECIKKAEEILQATGAQAISSTAEVSDDDASDELMPTRRSAA